MHVETKKDRKNFTLIENLFLKDNFMWITDLLNNFNNINSLSKLIYGTDLYRYNSTQW